MWTNFDLRRQRWTTERRTNLLSTENYSNCSYKRRYCKILCIFHPATMFSIVVETHLSLSATKITLRSRSSEAKTRNTCRTLRHLNRLSKSTCSSLESLGRLSSMTWIQEKIHTLKSNFLAYFLLWLRICSYLIIYFWTGIEPACFVSLMKIGVALATVLTSFPAPGRKVFTLIIFPGAGKGDSIRLLMKG